MRKITKKVELTKKYSIMGQYGESEDENSIGEFETLEEKEAKFASSVGMLILSFSNLENSVDNDLATSINERGHEPGYRIIKYLNFRTKINLWKDDYYSLVKLSCPKDKQEVLIKKVDATHAKLAELSEFRNKVAHANWQSLDANGFVRTKIIEDKELGCVSFEKVKMTPGILIKFIRQNNSLANKLESLRESVWEVIRKSDKKYSQLH